MSSIAAMKRGEQQEAIARLKEWIKPGDTLYTILRHRSASGMMRIIQVVKLEHNEPTFLGYNIALACGDTYSREHEGVKVRGCGMDMGFELVYRLGQTLWPNGTDTPHGTRNGQPDSSGGYALNQRWL